MKKLPKRSQQIWGMEAKKLQDKKDLKRAEKIIKRELRKTKDESKKEKFKEVLQALINGRENNDKPYATDDFKFEPDYLIINEIIEKRNLDNLLDCMYKLKNYFNVSEENFFKIISRDEIEDCVNSINNWMGYSESYTNLHPIIFNDEFEDFTDLIICFNDLTPSMVSVEFILKFKRSTKEKLEGNISKNNAARNVFPYFFKVDDKEVASTNVYADYIVKNKVFSEDIARIKWSFLYFINEEIGIKTYLYELGVPAVSILYSKINSKYLANYSNGNFDNIPVMNGYKIPLHLRNKVCDFLYVDESYELLDQDYNCLNLLVSSECKDDKNIDEIWDKVIKQWYMFGQISSIFAVIMKKKQLQEKYLNNNLNTISEAKMYRTIVKQNYDYSELILKYNELLEVVKIYPFKDKFIKMSNSAYGQKQLRRIVSNLKKSIYKINARTKQVENLVAQKQKIITSKYDSKKEKSHSRHSGCSLLIAVIALVVSIIGQWGNLEPLIHNIIVYFQDI